MWDEITKGLAQFPDAVLTVVDEGGYPLSIRCHPQVDAATKVLRVPSASGLDLRPGLAALPLPRREPLEAESLPGSRPDRACGRQLGIPSPEVHPGRRDGRPTG